MLSPLIITKAQTSKSYILGFYAFSPLAQHEQPKNLKSKQKCSFLSFSLFWMSTIEDKPSCGDENNSEAALGSVL